MNSKEFLSLNLRSLAAVYKSGNLTPANVLDFGTIYTLEEVEKEPFLLNLILHYIPILSIYLICQPLRYRVDLKIINCPQE